MKKTLTIFALIISVVAMGQETIFVPDSIINKYHLFSDKADTIFRTVPYYPLNIGFGITAPAHDVEIKAGDKSLNFDFKGDSLIVTGDVKLDESAKVFIDFCRKYMKTKIDSLEAELQKCKKIFLNQKVNYIPGEGGNSAGMGNSSIYDDTTKRLYTLTDTTVLFDWFLTEGTAYDHLGRLCFIGIDSAYVKAWKEREANYKEPLKDKILTFQMLLDYEKECLTDTIKATQYDYKSEFLILYGTFGEVVTEKQMEKRGYKYVSGYFYGTNPFKLDYYFVKEATLKGFIQWYREKVN